MHSKIVLIICNGLMFSWKYFRYLYTSFQDDGIKIKSTLQTHVRVISYEVWGTVAAKLVWVDPTDFVAMKLNTYLICFTKLSRKSLYFSFLVGKHLKIYDISIHRGRTTWKTSTNSALRKTNSEFTIVVRLSCIVLVTYGSLRSWSVFADN